MPDTLYNIPVYEVEERDCDMCQGADVVDLMLRKPRHIHLCSKHMEQARAMFIHDVMRP